MHLIFERYKGRFRSNCNILALAWTPYHQESKFRQALLDYHQKQLIHVTRSTQNASSQLQRQAGPSNAEDVRNQDFNLVPPGQAARGEEIGHNSQQETGIDRHRLDANRGKNFPNSRLAEQHQRYVMSKSDPSKASIESNFKQSAESAFSCVEANNELDARYGRMSDFGWLAIGNIGKIVGVTLTSTASPPTEIDGRRSSSNQNGDDLILLDDNEPTIGQVDATQTCSATIGSSPLVEQTRPDRKCSRSNYNLRGHLDEIILVKWNELYQKLATVDSKGNVLIWCKVNEKFTIQTPFYNRSKSVADFKWSNDGKTALICFTDSFILVGSSSSQRHWHSMLNLEDYHITSASWAPNDEQLLLGVSNGNVVVIDLPHSQLTELVVGVAHIRAMCWSSSDMNLRHLGEKQGGDRASSCFDATTFAWPARTGISAIVSQRRLSRDCSLFSRYRFCSQGPINGNSGREDTQDPCRGACRAQTGRGLAADSYRNILAMDFANNTIKLFDGGLNDAKPVGIEVKLESYLMAWSSDGKVLAVAGFNISTSAVPPRCLRCKYLNHLKFYTQRGDLILDLKLNFTRYPITALTWAHDDRRLFVATGPRLHCARVYFGVAKLSLLAMSCVHRNTKYPNKVELLDSLFRQQKQRTRFQQHEQHFKNSSLLNWQSFNCPLELEDVLASSEQPLMSASSYASSTQTSFTPSPADEGLEQAVLKYNFNISHYQLPAKLKMAVDQLFLHTLRQPFDEQLTLADIAWHVPKNQQRCYCTLICYTHELVDIGCGATIGHQYKTHEFNERHGSTGGPLNGQSSDQFKIFVLYVEYQGSLIPILKARRIGVLKPEFVIFDPEGVSSKHPHRRQKVSDIASLAHKFDPYLGANRPPNTMLDRHQPARLSHHNCVSLHDTPNAIDAAWRQKAAMNAPSIQQSVGASASTATYSNNPSHPLLADPNIIHMLNSNSSGSNGKDCSQPHGKSSKDLARSKSRATGRQDEARRMAIERYRAMAGRNIHTNPSNSKSLKTLPETSELVRIRSNIWGTRFKVINVGNRMIAQRSHLGSVTYKASILHLQPRQIFLTMKDMTNYCILCSMHHHTRAREECAPKFCASEREKKTTTKCGQLESAINLIDLPIVHSVSEFATPLRSGPSARSGAHRRQESLRANRDRKEEDKIVLPVGDNIRVAPKLESNQHYKLSCRSSPSSRHGHHKAPNSKPSSSKSSLVRKPPQYEPRVLPPNQQPLEPVAGSSRSFYADKQSSGVDDDILTISLDEGNQVQLGMVTNDAEKRPECNRQLEEFLEENKTLKSIQTITKMIVDLSSKAQDEEQTVSARTGNNENIISITDQQLANQTSPSKILKLSNREHGEAIRSPVRYVPPETPVHRPRRVAANGLRASALQSEAGIRVQSVSSTPIRQSRNHLPESRKQRQLSQDHSMMREDLPLPPPPPSVPFRRKLSRSAKRFFDGSLRSLTGASGYSTAEELDDSEDCEPLMNRRDRRLVSKLNFAHNQSQPCTPMRSKPHSAQKQSIDLAQLRDQLFERFRSSTSRSGREQRPAGSKTRRGANSSSTSQLESSACTRKSRWVHKDVLAQADDSRGYSADSELDYSSNSSSDSSTSSSSSSLNYDNDGSRGDAMKGNELSFMRHVNSVRHFGKKSAKSLTDLARANSSERRPGKQADSGVQLGERKRPRRRHNRKSICSNANCCCAREFKLNNRPPVWNELSEVYQLDFGGRVTQESAKNLQIDFNGNLALQFGRIDRCTYTLDYKYPFNAVQAMSIALASLTQRLK